MTAPEKALVRKAIKLIHQEDDYYGGMDILWKLIGETPTDHGELKEMDIKEILGHDGGTSIDPKAGMESFTFDDEERKPMGFDYKNKQQ